MDMTAPEQVTTRPPLFFMRIPKCATSSVHKMIASHVPGPLIAEGYLSNEVLGVLAQSPNGRAVLAHLPLRDALPHLADFTKITILRDPIDRVLSMYFYIQRLAEVGDPTSELIRSMSLAQFVDSNEYAVQVEMNLMTYYLQPDNTLHDPASEAARDRALNSLVTNFGCVGLTSNMPAFFDRLGRSMSWPCPESLWENRGGPRSQVDLGIIRALQERTWSDRQVYEFARNWLDDVEHAGV